MSMTKNEPAISRRAILTGAGGATLAAGAMAAIGSVQATTSPRAVGKKREDGVCFVMPDVVDGPYYRPKAIIRQDITEGHEGIPLEIRVRIVDAMCRPIARARVDTWQADALGIYSDFPNQGDGLNVATLGQTYLRGTQITDGNGWVTFTSIYPGWYRGRTAHVHFKIYIGGKIRLTAQMYFPDAMNEFIFTTVPGYKRDMVRDTINATDWILEAGTRHSLAQVKEELDRYVATISYGVDPAIILPPSEKMPCPPAPALCVPAPGKPPVGEQRIAALVPSIEARSRPRTRKPPTP
jgi:protocatechuate 3,4-dioxygenase beta subunit